MEKYHISRRKNNIENENLVFEHGHIFRDSRSNVGGSGFTQLKSNPYISGGGVN